VVGAHNGLDFGVSEKTRSEEADGMSAQMMWRAGVMASMAAIAAGCGDDKPEVSHGAAIRLVSVEPADGVTGVALTTPLKLTFDGDVPQDKLTPEHLMLTPARIGTWSWDGATRAATFRPRGGWEANTMYTIKVGAGVLGAGERTSSFTTGESGQPQVSQDSYTSGAQRAQVTVAGEADALRTYTLTTNAELRDNVPQDKRRVVQEEAGQPRLRSGSVLFDSLFAMALDEVRELSVSSIRDGAFNNGQGVPCDCFETGEKWNYVWTRDTAYAAELGLALVDPQRTARSLLFKLSGFKGGAAGEQIVQDTGSGGSYPVSTDRVVWALGLWEVLQYMEGAERDALRDRAYAAMVNTIEHDRRVVYDPADGLYRGEQSFLDWREQSYPSWTAQDTVHLAMSKALSTNVGHLAILEIAAKLAAEKGDGAAQAKYKGYADGLREAIRRELWLEGAGMFSAMKPTGLDPTPLQKFELLGESLAVLWDVPQDRAQAARVVASYPHTEMGPPVLWPQQALTPIYHNRAIWPFVTAYGLLAAKKVGNAAVVEHDLESLVRGAALNLSNMENFEFLTQRAWVEDGAYSGPVVNSRRQLWSVAGYVGAVIKGVWGLEAGPDGLRVAPFVTPAIHKKWLGGGAQARLLGWRFKGKALSVTLVLPAQAPQTGGAYKVARVVVDGADAPGGRIAPGALKDGSVIEVTLEVDAAAQAGQVKVVVDEGDYRAFWAPREPQIAGIGLVDGKIALDLMGTGEEGARLNVYRDGVEVARGVQPGRWVDEASGGWAGQTYCYALEAEFEVSGNRSHHSRPQCWWGEAGASRVSALPIWGWWAQGGSWSRMHGQAHYQDWGRPSHQLETLWQPTWTGRHNLQAVYGNGAGGFNTGIVAAVKRLEVIDDATGVEVGGGTLVMPQLGEWGRWGESSLVGVSLEAGKRYRLRVVDDMNMSYLSHFTPYTGGPGGGEDSYNMVNIHALRVLPMAGRGVSWVPAVRPDGVDDLGKFEAGEQAEPGAKLASWSRVGIAWDERDVWFALVSPTFEDPYKPWMIYLRTVPGGGGAGLGMEYSGQRAQLPFAPTHAVVVRRQSEDQEGLWSGVWVPQSEGRWAKRGRFEYGESAWLAADNHTMVVRVPRAWLGGELGEVRLVAHVVNAQPSEEWKEVSPVGHTPWAGGGASYVLRLDGPSGAEWMVSSAP
jgi:glycogen debranching enzyme